MNLFGIFAAIMIFLWVISEMSHFGKEEDDEPPSPWWML